MGARRSPWAFPALTPLNPAAWVGTETGAAIVDLLQREAKHGATRDSGHILFPDFPVYVMEFASSFTDQSSFPVCESKRETRYRCLGQTASLPPWQGMPPALNWSYGPRPLTEPRSSPSARSQNCP
jgi:hypothetical protein